MNQVQFQAPPLTFVNKVILILSGVGFLLAATLKAIGALSLPQLLGLTGVGLSQGLLFQLVTYPFVETQLMSFIFNGLIIWFIGSEIESLWGRKVYLRFMLLNVLGVGLLFTLVNYLFFFGTPVFGTPLLGLSGMNFALLAAYAYLYPDRQLSLMMIFPMKARTFCMILAGMEAYLAIFNSFSTSWPHLFAMAISILLIKFQSNTLIHKVLNSSFSRSTPKKKGHLYVVKDEDQKPPKYWQ